MSSEMLISDYIPLAFQTDYLIRYIFNTYIYNTYNSFSFHKYRSPFPSLGPEPHFDKVHEKKYEENIPDQNSNSAACNFNFKPAQYGLETPIKTTAAIRHLLYVQT